MMQEFLALGGPAAIVHCLEARHDSLLLEAALGTLQSAAAAPELVRVLGQSGAFEAVLEICSSGGQPEAVRHASCLAISALCRNCPENCRRFRHSDVSPVFSDGLE